MPNALCPSMIVTRINVPFVTLLHCLSPSFLPAASHSSTLPNHKTPKFQANHILLVPMVLPYHVIHCSPKKSRYVTIFMLKGQAIEANGFRYIHLHECMCPDCGSHNVSTAPDCFWLLKIIYHIVKAEKNVWYLRTIGSRSFELFLPLYNYFWLYLYWLTIIFEHIQESINPQFGLRGVIQKF